MNKCVLSVALTLLVLTSRLGVAAEPLPPQPAWMPAGAILSVEIAQPKPVLDWLLDDKTIAAIMARPEYQQAAAGPQFQQLRAGVGFLEIALAADWRTALRKLIGRATLAVYPDGGALLVVDAHDPAMLKQLHDVLVEVAKNEAAKAGQPDRVTSAEYQGVTAWTFGGDEAHAVIGTRLLLANRPYTLRAALDLRAQPREATLGSDPAFQAARKAAPAEAVGVACVNMEMLKQHPPVAEALSTSGNPLAALLFAGVAETLRGSAWLAFDMSVDGGHLKFAARTDAKPDPASPTASFALPDQPTEGALANLTVPRLIAAFSFYRDLHAFYAKKDTLFPQRTSQLILFENMMGIFFTGRDLTDEVLAETKPHTRMVVAEQEYDAQFGPPQIQFPAVAIVFRVKNPDQFRDVVEEAWQKAIGLINVTRGQKAQPGLIFDRPVYNGVQYTLARFPNPTADDKRDLDVRLNLRPVLAIVGDFFVLSSTEVLARDLIDALKKEQAGVVQPLAGTHTLVELWGGRLASVLMANRATLVQQNMIEEGRSQPEAERHVDLLITLARVAQQAKLEISNRDGHAQAVLDLHLQQP